MKEMATFAQTNGLLCSIDPDTVTLVEGLVPSKEHKIRTLICHGQERKSYLTVIESHDAVMEALRAAGSNRKE